MAGAPPGRGVRGAVPTALTVLNMYFLLFRVFEQLAVALKNRGALEFFTVLKYFYHSRFLSNQRLP